MTSRLTLVTAGAVVALISCAQDANAPQVPLPSYATDVRRVDYSSAQYEVAFSPLVPNDLDDVRKFVGDWAEVEGWRKVPPEEDSWSVDSWHPTVNKAGVEIEQTMVHWVDPTAEWSLRLALRYYGRDRFGADAHIIVGPFEDFDLPVVDGVLEPCVYMPEESPQNPTPEIGPHENCARISEAGIPTIGADHLESVYYSDGLATFLVAGHWYYVKPDGSVLQVVASDNGPDIWADGLVRVRRAGKIAYADRSFGIVIPARYDWGWPFGEGRALVCNGCAPGTPEGEHTPVEGGFWGYIDLEGREVVPVRLSREEALAQ